jgi:4-amino-4-deoxy-L-arabinose transferase-like glycosyltransferase
MNGRWRPSPSALALAGILIAAATVAVLWVYRVPLLQSPDENVHLDYAFSLASAQRLITVRDGPVESRPLGRSNPSTAYLEQQTGFGDVVHRGVVKTVPDYGSAAFYRRLDEQAPPPAARQAVNPFAVQFFPFAYYALAAFVIDVLRFLGAGLAGQVFGARLLSVALLAGTLAFAYGSLRELRVPQRRALLLVALAGLLPLASFVASYVQPDNLVAFLVGAAVFCSLRARRSPAFRYELGAGLGLGVLAATKYQYFLCTAPPVLAMLLVEADRARWARSARRWLLLVAPSLVFGAIQLWVSWGAESILTHAGYQEGHGSYAKLLAAVHGGALPLAFYFLKNAALAFFDFFVGGPTLLSFWGYFGWLDTRLVIASDPVQSFVDALLGVATLWLFALTALRLRDVLRRLARIWRRGRRRTALRLALSNPLVNCYFLFTAFLYGLWVLTSDSFGSQGRYWMPYLPAVLLVATGYAPKALRVRRARGLLSQSVLAALCLYCAVGAFSALGNLEQRYYGNGRGLVPVSLASLAAAPGTTRYHVDYVVPSDLEPGVREKAVPRGGTLALAGWAVDERARQPAGTVFVNVDGVRDYQAVYGDDSPEAVKALGSQRYGRSGFDLIFPAGDLPPGSHYLTVTVVAHDLRSYYELPERIRFQVAG